MSIRQLRLIGNEGKDPARQQYPVFKSMREFNAWKAQDDAEKRARSIAEGTYGDRR